MIRVAEIDGISNEAVVGMFNDARATEYKGLATACQETLSRLTKGNQHEIGVELEKHHRRFQEIRQIDYFNSPDVHDAQVALQQAEKALAPRKAVALVPKLSRNQFSGKTWLTRPRPGIDRAGR